MNCRFIVLMGAMSFAGMLVVVIAAAQNASFSAYVNSDGAISLPKGFRTNMVHLGSWFVPQGGASGFHDVYTEADTAKVYRETGQFPDGATLVKELRGAEQGDYTTGNGVRFAKAAVKQWFVMVKDAKGRFPNNPLWGNGWGWGLYKPDDPARNLATDYRTDCLGCHMPAQASDWVYIEAYPTLKP